MSKLDTLQTLLTHYARGGKTRRVITSSTKAELLTLVGARESGDVIKYPHMWQEGGQWRTTTFDLVPR